MLQLHRKTFFVKGQVLKLTYKVLANLFQGFLSPIASVAAIVEQESHLLIVKRSDGLGYCLPGGIMYWRETTQEALKREVVEETGMMVEPWRVFDVYSGPARDPRVNAICIVYLAHYVSGDLRCSLEGDPYWIPFSDLTRLDYAFDHREIINLYRRQSN